MLSSSWQNKIGQEENHNQKEDIKPHLQWNSQGKNIYF